MTTVQDKILRAAQQCFRERGIHETSVLDIVVAAGVARSTFYRQFRDIDDILVTLAAHTFIARLPSLTAVLKHSELAASQRWRDFLASIVELGQDSDDPLRAEDINLHVTRLYYGAYPDKRQQIVDAMASLIDAGKMANELRTDIATERIVEWLLRQSWALSMLPMSIQWQRGELNDYIETFVLPSLLRREDDSGEPAAIQRLSDEVERLSRVVTRLETQVSPAP